MSKSGLEKQRLGEILVRQHLISQDELERLLGEQRRVPGSRLASALAESGKVADMDLLKALSEQHGVPGIDLAQVIVPLANLKLVPLEVSRKHAILPILVKEDRVFLAMSDPSDERVLAEIEFATGRKVVPYVALHESLSAVIEYAYAIAARGFDYYVGAFVPNDYLETHGLSRPPAFHELGVGSRVATISIPPAPGESREPKPFMASTLDSVAAPLPESTPPLPSEVESFAPLQGTAQPTVLIVDDVEDIRTLLKHALLAEGYRVVEASRGFEALSKVRDVVPDVILLDAMLPEIHGFDICRRIKGTRRYGHIPIIMMSAVYRGWRVVQDLKESYGVDEFLEKPFRIADVLESVKKVLSKEKEPEQGNESPDSLSDEAEKSLHRGLEAYKRGDLDTAITQLKHGISIDPLCFRLHYHLGLLYGRRENYYEAIHELEKAVDLQAHNFLALKNLAVLYQKIGFKHKAIELWERALGSAPSSHVRQGIKEHLVTLLG